MRLVDSGALAQVDAIDRVGLEAAWRSGRWSLQGEWLGIAVHRDPGRPGFHGSGHYAQGSWMLTGETKPNKGGGFGNPVPARKAGAVELALRHSTLDLDDGAIVGGRQRDWTLGANWYLTRELKFQANYVDRAQRTRRRGAGSAHLRAAGATDVLKVERILRVATSSRSPRRSACRLAPRSDYVCRLPAWSGLQAQSSMVKPRG